LKALTAVAFIVVGCAGWKLQHDAEQTRAATDQRERAERKYLPELRSISEVDVALLETSKEFDWATLTAEETAREARVGAHLAYLGDSLYFPDGEPSVSIASAADNLSKSNRAGVETKMRTAVLFLAEFMRFAPLFRRWQSRSDARVVVRGDNLLIVTPKQAAPEYVDFLDPRTAELWQRWLPLSGAPPEQLFRDIDLTDLADPLHERLIKICTEIVGSHGDLADKYVEIRSDVLKSRANLIQ
jgi:hypothetical protein